MKLKTIVQMAKDDPIPIVIAIWVILILSVFLINDPRYPRYPALWGSEPWMRLWVGMILILLMACTFVSKGKFKIIGEYLTSVVIAAWTFLTVDTVPPYERTFTYFFIGVLIILILFVHTCISKSPRKSHLFSAKVIAMTLVLVMCWFAVLSVEGVYTTPIYYYDIEITGLDHYQNIGITDIIVPLPVKDGEQIFTDEELQYRSFGDWTSLLVMTKEGKMLAFQSTNATLTDIRASFRKEVDVDMLSQIKNPVKYGALLHPISDVVPHRPNERDDYRVYMPSYVTYIYIDEDIEPMYGGDNPITFHVCFVGSGRRVLGVWEGMYSESIHEEIPEDLGGPIPVGYHIYST